MDKQKIERIIIYALFIFLVIILLISYRQDILADKEVKNKVDQIQIIEIGNDRYQLNKKQDIVYLLPNSIFRNKIQIFSPNTGKPMTCEEFESTIEN